MGRQETDIVIAPYRFGQSWIVGARTYLVDRFNPQVELIHMPACTYAGGLLTLFRDDEATIKRAPRPGRVNRMRAWLAPGRPVDFGRAPILDLRWEHYFNWSHQINRLLPLAGLLRERLVTPDERVTVILPAGMPPFMEQVYRHFGFDALRSDGPVGGCRLGWRIDDYNVVLSHVHHITREWSEDRDGRYFPVVEGLPKKIFISRRKQRAIVNAAEVEALLASRGYETIYAEDYSPFDQFALLRQATDVVAIHGAAIAPILFRERGRDFTLLEILPAGHMTNFYQMMCDQVGGRYCAVRGRIKARYIAGAYADEPFVEYSLDDFEVDPESLKVALEILRRGGPADEYPDRWRDEAGDTIRPKAFTAAESRA